MAGTSMECCDRGRERPPSPFLRATRDGRASLDHWFWLRLRPAGDHLLAAVDGPADLAARFRARLGSAAPTLEPARRGTETILLVEDEEALRDLVAQMLRDRGHTVLEAGLGSTALEVAHSYPGLIDLLLSDVVMPGMSGRILPRRRSPSIGSLPSRSSSCPDTPTRRWAPAASWIPARSSSRSRSPAPSSTAAWPGPGRSGRAGLRASHTSASVAALSG